MKIIGIVSDIHGYLSDEAHEALRGSDYILCAGDCETMQVVIELESIAPSIIVRGNCDHRDLGPGVDNIAGPLIDGVRFKMVHRPQDVGHIPDDVNVVICGHTHVPQYKTENGVTFINPGSPTRPRNGSCAGVGRLIIDKGRIISYERVELP